MTVYFLDEFSVLPPHCFTGIDIDREKRGLVALLRGDALRDNQLAAKQIALL